MSAAQLVERLGFTKERAWTPVSELSGGERRRLQLARLLVHSPNVLMLDEPTNDLDTDTLTAMEDVLDGFPGTLVVVSHDRYLLERVCDGWVALLGDGKLRDLPRGVEQYLELRHAITDPTPQRDHGKSVQHSSAAEVRAARKEMARIERQLSRLAEREQKLHARMTEQATDHAAVLELDAELRQLTVERDALEEEWLAAADVVE